MNDQKTNWWQVILVLLIGAGAVDGFMWYLYNTYVPLYLQGGNPNFVADVVGFGLTPKIVGIILVIDNIAAMILAPIIGAWSDGYRGQYGRRMPFVLATVPVAAIALAIIPFVYRAIPIAASGDLSQLYPLFFLFFLLLLILVVCLAVARTPIDALVYDLAPSKDRTKARSLGIILATLLAIGLGILGAILYDINLILPYLLSLAVTVLLVGIGALTIKERKGSEIIDEDDPTEKIKQSSLKRSISIVQKFPSENKQSILLMMGNIFLGMFAFSLIQAFISSYNMTVMGAELASAGLPFLVAGGTVMLVAFPAALLANKFGRKMIMMVGCIGWALFALLIFLLPTPGLFLPLIVIMAAFYGLWFVNSFVTLIDSAPDDKTLGTMTGLTTMANMAGMAIGPAITGLIIELTGYNYNMIFLVQVIVVLLAFLVLIPVRKGEMRKVNG